MTRTDEGVLFLNRLDNIARHQGTLQHLLRIQPDAHAILTNAEDVDIRYAIHPSKFVAQLQCGVVTKEKSVVIVLRRSEGDDLQDGSGFLLRYHALLLDCLW